MANNNSTTDVQQQPTNQLSPAQRANARRLFFRQELAKRADTFQEVLPKQIPFQKFLGAVMQHCILNPALLECTPQSIFTCAMKCAQLGLLPDTYTGEAHLIPFKNTSKGGALEAQFIPGYRGLVQLAIRTGKVKRFQARAVKVGDDFTYSLGTEEYIKHLPKGESNDISHFYAIIEFTNGGLMFDVMTQAEVNLVRDASPNYKNTKPENKQYTIWAKHYEEMGKKTVIRKLAKYAPISSEFQMAVSLDEQVEVIGEGQHTEDVDWEELTPAEQEQMMADLLEKDKQHKEEVKARVTRPGSQGSRAANLQQQTEDLLNKGK